MAKRDKREHKPRRTEPRGPVVVSRRMRQHSQVIGEALLVLGIIALVNVIAGWIFFRLDLTADKRYTLTQATKGAVEGLQDNLTINAYFSRKLPPQYAATEDQVRDLLAEYKRYGGRRVKVRFIDPETNSNEKELAEGMGIPQVQVQVVERDQAQSVNAYMGIAILYSDKHETIPVIQNTANLEYDLTSSIVKMTSNKVQKIGFLSRAGRPQESANFNAVRGALQKSYDVTDVDVSKGDPVPDDVGALVVTNGVQLSDREKYEIDQFLMKGGKVAILQNGVELQQGMQGVPSFHSLDDMLKAYGMKLNKDALTDVGSNAMASFRSGYFSIVLPYPFWVKVLPKNLDAKFPATSKLDSIVLPWPSSVEPDANAPKGEEIKVLAKTTDKAGSSSYPYNFSPQAVQGLTPKTTKQADLVLLASGKIPSFFAGKPVPPVTAAPTPGLQPPATPPTVDPKTEGRATIKVSDPKAELLLVGTSRLIDDNYVQNFPQNAVFFQNMMDSFLLGDKLIGIRSRTITDRPLANIGEAARGGVRYVNMIGVPILVVLYGVYQWLRRGARRRALESKYAQR